MLVDDLLPVGSASKLLDAGCGSGVFSGYLGAKGARVWGVDANEEAVSFAQRTYGRDNVTFSCAPLHRVSLPDASVNCILLSEVLEHLTPPYLAIVAREFDRLLMPGGVLLVTAPNYLSLWPLIEMTLDLFRLVPSLHDQHVTHTTIGYLKRCSFNSIATLEQLGTFNYLLPPLLATIKWGWGERLARVERHVRLPWGVGVYALWRKTVSA